MKALAVITLLIVSCGAWSQAEVDAIRDLLVSRPFPDSALQRHDAIQPAIRIPKIVLTNEKVGFDTQAPVRYFRISANPDMAAQYDTALFYRAAAGINIEAAAGRTFYNRTSISTGWSTREGMNQTHVAFTPLHNRDQFWYTDIRTRFAYTPNDMLHIAAGIDNQFFGEGARSLLQGDQVAPNPFALMRVNAWRLEYGLLYQFFHENRSTDRLWKFAATHYLSYNVTRKWNIALFETVLFQPKDSTFNRGFEVEYLNPIAFFRPQEYSVGSSDNVLLGLQTAIKLKQHVLYGQLSLDEFVLKEIRARSRWWANKYGVQLGVKGKLAPKVAYRLEGNAVRPYTYAHINDGQNAGNQGRPLGHPLGSNFAEVLAEVQLSRPQFQLKAYGLFQLQGLDEDSLSLGGNVYQSYLNRPKDYDNRIGQGVTVRTVRIGAEVSHYFPTLRWLAYIDPQLVYQWGDVSAKLTPAITAGVRTKLFQERRRF